MSESTEELKTAVQGASEVLTETENFAEQLSSQATELAEEAAGHGWHAMATRMQEVAEALAATTAQISMGGKACEKAVEEIGLINDKIPAEEVVAHLSESTNQLGEAETALQGAVEKAEEAQTAAAEIGQEGMMQATSDLHDQLTEIQEQIGQHRSTSEEEHAAADAYAKRQLGN
jgi:flagellar biosynthesis chaperone FliJ